MSGDETRTYSYDTPARFRAAIGTLDGAAYLQRIIGEGWRVPIAETMGFRLTEAGGGECVVEARPGDFSVSPLGTVQGGWYASVLDAALGLCLVTVLAQGESFTTLELKVNYIRGAVPGGGPYVARGRVIHKGRTTAVTEAQLTDGAGKVFAHSTSTCLIVKV